MPRPKKAVYFGKETSELLRVISNISADRKKAGHILSLSDIARELRKEFKGLPPPPVKPKNGKKKPVDPLKHVIYRLCNANKIWFGDPSDK